MDHPLNDRARPRVRGAAGLLALTVTLASASSCAGRGYDSEPWLRDYAQLRAHMEGAYANLEWMIERRGLDVVALHAATERRIREARSGRGAEKALQAFVAAFGDPHLRIEKPPGPLARAWRGLARGNRGAPEPIAVPLADGPDAVCDAFGWGHRNPSFRLDFPGEAGFRWIAREPFPAGILPVRTVAGAKSVALLRIAHLGEDGYRRVAEELWPSFAASRTGDCDDECLDAFWWATGQELVGRFTKTVRALTAEKPDVLVLDLTGNGGGTVWGDAAVRALTPLSLQCPTAGYVRHAHTLKNVARERERLEAMLATTDAGSADSVLTALAVSFARELEARVMDPCDRSRVWTEGADALACSQVAIDTSGCGALPYAPPSARALGEDAHAVFGPLRYAYEEGVYRGPLAVLVDEHTASAAEGLAALLQGNGAARVIGGRTLGAGCGYTYGGIPAVLAHSGWTVRMPDCVRYRMDGVNELEGIEPDVPLYAADDGAGRRLDAILAWFAEDLSRPNAVR